MDVEAVRLLKAKIWDYECSVGRELKQKRDENLGAINVLLDLLNTEPGLTSAALEELERIRNGPLILDKIFPRIEKILGKQNEASVAVIVTVEPAMPPSRRIVCF